MLRLSTALHSALLMLAVQCVVAVPTVTIVGPPPHVGNGYTAAFLNNTAEYIAGVFSGHTTQSTRAAIPATTTRLTATAVGGDVVRAAWSLSEFKGEAMLDYLAQDGAVAARQTWFAARPPSFLEEAESLNLLGTVVTAFESFVDANVSWAIPTIDTASLSSFAQIRLLERVSTADGVQVAVFETVVAEEAAPNGGLLTVALAWNEPTAATTTVSSGQTVHFVSSRCTTLDLSKWDPSYNASTEDLVRCATRRFEAVTRSIVTTRHHHQAAWADLWEGGFFVNASNSVNAVVESSFYALYSSLHERVPLSTSPGGLPTDGYNGHTFWDMETWMMPTLVLVNPLLTRRSPIQYRLDRQAGAAVNADSVVGGKTGIAFPWESALTGFDVCPWPQGEKSEIHITADVVNAWALYYHATGDREFLAQAFDALVNTSRFWLSRAIFNATDGEWHIDGVTPPDEYHFGNDSAYTNSAVRAALNFTLEAARDLNRTIPEYMLMTSFIEKVHVPYDAVLDYHPEFTGYKGDTVKQADVVLMTYPIGVPMAASTARNDLVFYAGRTDPGGPAMTWSVFSIGYMGLADVGNASAYFHKGYAINTFPPYYQWFEVAGGGGCPNFLTGAGGFLQSVWAGIGGIRVTPGALRVTTAAMLDVDTIVGLDLRRIWYQGAALRIRYVPSPLESAQRASAPLTAVRVAIARLPLGDVHLSLVVNGRPLTAGGEEHTFDLALDGDVSVQRA